MNMEDNKPKLDIFGTLRNIDKGNIHYYDNLSDEERKLFVPVVIMQWMVGTNDPLQRILVNDYVNKYVFSLYRHPALLYKLMTIVGDGQVRRYTWRPAAKRKTNFPKSVDVVKSITGYSTKRAIDSLRVITNEQIVEMAKSLGYQQEELTALNTELKTR